MFGAIAGGIASALAGGAMSKLFGGGQKAASGGIQAPVLQTPKATSSTLYFDSLTVNAGNGGFLHCIQMDTSVNAANQVVSVGADIAFDADPKFFACLVRFESSSVPTTLPTAYDVYPLDGRHDGGYYTVKDCVTIDVLPR